MIIELMLIFIILLAGSFIQGVSGFGFGLIAMSFLPLLFTIKESTLLVVSLALVVAVSIGIQMWRHIRWKSLGVLLSAAFAGRVGAFFVLARYGEMDIMKDILGAFLLMVVVYLFFGAAKAKNVSIKSLWIPMLFGFLGGFVGGLFAVGGPFFVFVLMILYADDKYAYSANMQVTFMFTNSITLLLHAFNRDFTSGFLLYFLVGVVTVLIGTKLGVLCFKYISQENMRRVAGAVVALAALNLLLFQ